MVGGFQGIVCGVDGLPPDHPFPASEHPLEPHRRLASQGLVEPQLHWQLHLPDNLIAQEYAVLIFDWSRCLQSAVFEADIVLPYQH